MSTEEDFEAWKNDHYDKLMGEFLEQYEEEFKSFLMDKYYIKGD